MKAVWTYSEKLQKGPVNSQISKEDILYMYKQSIKCGERYYKTCVYTTEASKEFFAKLVDEVVILPEDFDYVFLGDLKYYVMQNEKAPFILVDGDLFLEKELELDNSLAFAAEVLLKYDPSRTASKFNECFEREGIKEVIPYWQNGLDNHNLGLLYVNSTEYVQELCRDYLKVKQFYKTVIEPKYGFDQKNEQPSVSGVQYFFSLFCNYKGVKVGILKDVNKFTHLATSRKFKYDPFNKKLI